MSGSRTKNLFKVILVAGARPNFMKVAPIIKEMEKFSEIKPILVHTGQHYDKNMSDLFFEELGIPEPYINLEVGSASHAIQTAEIMRKFEAVVLKEKPDLVVVVGDVNSTIACALVASKIEYRFLTHNSKLTTQNLGVSRPLIAHVEAGLRSFDRTMPEEINRILTDSIADFLFTTEESANENLRREGIPEQKIFFVGNTMIDTLLKHVEKARQSKILEKMGLINSQLKTHNSKLKTQNLDLIPFGLLTLHRPSNVDNKESFQNILGALLEVSKHIPIIFPAHPRTLDRIKEFHFEEYFEFVSQNSTLKIKNYRINCLDPLGYLDFLSLMIKAKLVFTDSGGIQEETTILGIPCLTIRENTERPVTVNQGTNVIVGGNKEKIVEEGLKAINNASRSRQIPPLWDGKAAQRVVRKLLDQLRIWEQERRI